MLTRQRSIVPQLPLHIINLKRRTDRLFAIENHLRQFPDISALIREGSDAQRYPDIPGISRREKAGIHCCISHKLLLETLPHNNLFHLIGEDDLHIKDWEYIKECLNDFSNSSYDILNIGYDPRWQPEFESSHGIQGNLRGVKGGKCLCTHLYAIKSTAIPSFIKAIEFAASSLLAGHLVFTHNIDHSWTFPQFNLRVCVPARTLTQDDMPAIQRESVSDINVV
jgi:hypothetical protein